MFSKELIDKYAQVLKLTDELEEMVQVETDGRFSLCNAKYLQLWSDPSMHHTLEEVRELGCEIYSVTNNDGYAHVRFTLDGHKGVVVLRKEDVAIIDIDAALSMDGGAANDVEADSEA